MHDDRSKLVLAVAAATTVIAGAVALIGNLGERLRNALDADDTDALNALADELNSNKDALAAAIVANTPAAEDAPPVTVGSVGGPDTFAAGDGADTIVAGEPGLDQSASGADGGIGNHEATISDVVTDTTQGGDGSDDIDGGVSAPGAASDDGVAAHENTEPVTSEGGAPGPIADGSSDTSDAEAEGEDA